MTDREAIELISPETGLSKMAEIEYYHGFEGLDAVRKALSDANALAITALQEREERRKGCEFCRNKDDDSLWEPGGAHDFRLYQDGIFYYDQEFGWEGTTIRFCPWCGRVLKTAMPVGGIMRDLSGAVIKGEHTQPFAEYDHSGENTAMPGEEV